MQQLATYPASTPTDFLPLKGIDHLEFYVGIFLPPRFRHGAHRVSRP
jgi:hypothetical protein